MKAEREKKQKKYCRQLTQRTEKLERDNARTSFFLHSYECAKRDLCIIAKKKSFSYTRLKNPRRNQTHKRILLLSLSYVSCEKIYFTIQLELEQQKFT